MPEPEYTCRWCGQGLWRNSLTSKRGSEWYSNHDPENFQSGSVFCTKDPVSPRHKPDLPDLDDMVELEAWLDGVREGLNP